MLRWRSSLVALLLLLARVSALAPQPPEGEEEALPDPHSTEEIEEAREEFESIDTNKDGFISREEILEMEEVPEREEIDEFFSTYDTNGDGRVTFDEILNADESVRASLRKPASRLTCADSRFAHPLAWQLRKNGDDAEAGNKEL